MLQNNIIMAGQMVNKILEPKFTLVKAVAIKISLKMSICIDIVTDLLPNKQVSARQQKMTSRQNSYLVTNNRKDCECCERCKDRISILEQMVNNLYCYMSEFLPEELDGISQTMDDEIYYPNSTVNYSTINYQTKPNKYSHKPKIQRPIQNSKIKTYKTSKDNLIIGSYPLQNNNNKPRRGRKQYASQQKQSFVLKVQQACLSGQKITDVCSRLGISDRSYQRWKNALEYSKIDEHISQDQILIQNSHL